MIRHRRPTIPSGLLEAIHEAMRSEGRAGSCVFHRRRPWESPFKRVPVASGFTLRIKEQ